MVYWQPLGTIWHPLEGPGLFLFSRRILYWRSLGSHVGAEDFWFQLFPLEKLRSQVTLTQVDQLVRVPYRPLGRRKNRTCSFFWVGGWVGLGWPVFFFFFGWGKKTHEKTTMKCKSVLKLKHEVAAETLNLLWANFEENLIRMTRRSSLGLVTY